MSLKNSLKKPFIFDTQITTHALRLTDCDAAVIVNNAADFFDMQQYVYSFYALDKICTVYDVYNIEACFIAENNIESINKKISDYIKAGLSANGSFTLYFNDIPADIDPEKLKAIFKHIKSTRDLN